jgi:hypothetical protein
MSANMHRRALVAHLMNGMVEWRTTRPHYMYGWYYIRVESVPRQHFFPITHSSDKTSVERTPWLDRDNNSVTGSGA